MRARSEKRGEARRSILQPRYTGMWAGTCYAATADGGRLSSAQASFPPAMDGNFRRGELPCSGRNAPVAVARQKNQAGRSCRHAESRRPLGAGQRPGAAFRRDAPGKEPSRGHGKRADAVPAADEEPGGRAPRRGLSIDPKAEWLVRCTCLVTWQPFRLTLTMFLG